MTQTMAPSLPSVMIEDAVRAALVEDLGRAGDITSNATIAPQATARAVLASRQAGVIAGLGFAQSAFAQMTPPPACAPRLSDGDRVMPGDVIAEVAGNARAILAAERVALNFLMMLSGIATHTDRFVQAVAGTGSAVCDTRKTVPGHRAFAKYAVRCGGGANHRFGLDDAVLIKDNHIAVAGGVAKAVSQARAHVGHMVRIEIEVDTLDQLREALGARPDAILLDNMTNDQLRDAVAINRADNDGQVKLEASGNVDLDTIAAVAQTGVDYISTSKITMAAPTLDIGLDVMIDS